MLLLSARPIRIINKITDEAARSGFSKYLVSKMWGGRFKCVTNPELKQLNSSIEIDKRMFLEDIIGSKEYAKALTKINLLSQKECELICNGFEMIKNEWTTNKFTIKEDEDVHSANERRLKELIGEAALKLHAGRSRNDQVVTDMKLWMKSSIAILDNKLKNFIAIMLSKAKLEIDVLFPGYTHLQKAQPVRWSHWLLSHVWSFKSDCEKLKTLYKSTDCLPLGSGALAGNPFDINRQDLAQNLGFSSITANSMHAVGDRDFVAEFLFWISLTGTHLTKLSEDLILFTTKEFGYMKIHDAFSTGSSLMPQKRNPDCLELVRGIGGSLFGYCCSFMMILKSLPSTYNKDLQIDKELMFAAYDKILAAIDVITGTMECLEVNYNKCQDALSFDMLATDLAYYLVRKSIPFREAHRVAGKVVAEAENRNVELCDFTLEELKAISPHFEVDVASVWNYENSVEQYNSSGGTAKASVLKQMQDLDFWMEQNEISSAV